ncbi:hypothetical protein BaRGS_00012480 [Batillaria attramentaria]|uniref:Uncharacterized protein n=1 Tax=Batillaria attramentaria TaxID=370345 RepID=A0ABD0LAR8_9CAEN
MLVLTRQQAVGSAAADEAPSSKDPRFNQEIDKQTGYRTHSILSMPISNYEGEVIGVAQIINKIDGNHEFTKQDEDLFRKYLIFCGIGITNAQLFEMSVNEFKRNQGVSVGTLVDSGKEQCVIAVQRRVLTGGKYSSVPRDRRSDF